MDGGVHIIKIPIDIYRYTIIAALYDDVDTFNKYLEEELKLEATDYDRSIYSASCQYYPEPGISLAEFNVNVEGITLGTIAHELLHASIQCLQRSGIPVNAENDEAIAYILGYAIEKLAKDETFSNYISDLIKIKKE